MIILTAHTDLFSIGAQISQMILPLWFFLDVVLVIDNSGQQEFLHDTYTFGELMKVLSFFSKPVVKRPRRGEDGRALQELLHQAQTRMTAFYSKSVQIELLLLPFNLDSQPLPNPGSVQRQSTRGTRVRHTYLAGALTAIMQAVVLERSRPYALWCCNALRKSKVASRLHNFWQRESALAPLPSNKLNNEIHRRETVELRLC